MDTRLDTMAEHNHTERQRQQLNAAIAERNAQRTELLNAREELGRSALSWQRNKIAWKTP